MERIPALSMSKRVGISQAIVVSVSHHSIHGVALPSSLSDLCHPRLRNTTLTRLPSFGSGGWLGVMTVASQTRPITILSRQEKFLLGDGWSSHFSGTITGARAWALPNIGAKPTRNIWR